MSLSTPDFGAILIIWVLFISLANLPYHRLVTNCNHVYSQMHEVTL